MSESKDIRRMITWLQQQLVESTDPHLTHTAAQFECVNINVNVKREYTRWGLMTVVHSPLHHKWVFLLHGQMWVDFNRIVRILQFIQLEERKKKKRFRHKYIVYLYSIRRRYMRFDMLYCSPFAYILLWLACSCQLYLWKMKEADQRFKASALSCVQRHSLIVYWLRLTSQRGGVDLLWQVGQRFPLIENLLNVMSKSVMI